METDPAAAPGARWTRWTVISLVILLIGSVATLWTLVALDQYERLRNMNDSVIGLAPWSLFPCVALAGITWSFRTQARASVVMMVATIVVIGPPIPFMVTVALAPNGDGQLGLGLMIYPIVQLVLIAVFWMIAVAISLRRRARG